jgi:hypothetical protein
MLKAPSFQTNCTFYETTKTSTSYTDCGGCELKTKFLGVGLVSTVLLVFGDGTKRLMAYM